MAQVTGLPDWFEEAKGRPCPSGGRVRGLGFIEKTLGNIASTVAGLLDQQRSASERGLLQAINPPARIGGILVLISGAAVAGGSAMLAAIAVVTAVLTAFSRVSFAALGKRVLPAFATASILAAPVFFGLTGGRSSIGAAALTMEGAATGLFFMARVTVMASLAALLLLTTRQADFFRGLRALPVPGFFVSALFMTFRYVFILLKTAEDSALARKSRTICRTGTAEAQRWFASRVLLLLKKSLSTADEVNGAMISRGFSGGRLKTFDGGPLAARDYAWLMAAFFVFFLAAVLP